MGTSCSLTSLPACKASQNSWGTYFVNQDPSFYSKRTEARGWVMTYPRSLSKYEAGPGAGQHLLTQPLYIPWALAASCTRPGHSTIHLSPVFQTPLSWGIQHRIILIHISDNNQGWPGYRLWAETSLGCPCCSAAIPSLHQGFMSLSFLGRARCSAVPFPKSKWWQQPGMQSRQKEANLPAKASQRPHTLWPSLSCLKAFFLGNQGTPCQPTPTKGLFSRSLPHIDSTWNQGRFLLTFFYF